MTPTAAGRLARDDEVAQWDKDGWVLLDGLIATGEIDAAADDLFRAFPRPDRFHADPARYIPPGRTTAELRRGHPEYPEHGPAWRPEQHRWGHEFPFYGDGALNRLVVHDAIVDFAERALQTRDIRCYQAAINARYAGDADYEQPMHTDRNHSFLAPPAAPPWWHVEGFLYLTDVEDDLMPTHLVTRNDAEGRSVNDVHWPDTDPELYARERPAPGPRGSLLVYRSDVFHRAVNMERAGGARFLLNVSYKRADVDWIAYHSIQPRATHPAWTQFVGDATPQQLALFGWPPPGHPVWTDALLSATKEKYPALRDEPWRNALRQ